MSKCKIKCVVWDLDQTIWNGILTEDEHVVLNKKAIEVIKKLDNRGILQSISSKNDYHAVMDKLREFGIAEYFLYPQIGWGAKSESIFQIAKSLNIGIDTFAFVDDQKFERDEVNFVYKEVLCIDAAELDSIPDMEEFMPQFVTEDSKNRRLLYMNDIKRNSLEEKFVGPKEDFLKKLKMTFMIARAGIEDLKRVEELTIRTHQLNSTGAIYSFDELTDMIASDRYEVIITELEDQYGSYGKIGICVVEKKEESWYIRLLLMSCRVMSRGVGTVLINFITKQAKEKNKKLYADFVQTDRNRIMYITYKFNGFKELSNENGNIVFEADLKNVKSYPDYINVDEEIEL